MKLSLIYLDILMDIRVVNSRVVAALASTNVCHLFLEVDEAIALIDEEELESTTAKVVASEMDLSQLGQLPLEVLCVARLSARSVIKEMHVSRRDLELTFHHFHHCHQLTFLL